MVGQVGVQALIVEFGSQVFSTSGLSADLWLWCVFLGSTSLLWGQILTLIVMPLINNIHKRKGMCSCLSVCLSVCLNACL